MIARSFLCRVRLPSPDLDEHSLAFPANDLVPSSHEGKEGSPLLKEIFALSLATVPELNRIPAEVKSAVPLTSGNGSEVATTEPELETIISLRYETVSELESVVSLSSENILELMESFAKVERAALLSSVSVLQLMKSFAKLTAETSLSSAAVLKLKQTPAKLRSIVSSTFAADEKLKEISAELESVLSFSSGNISLMRKHRARLSARPPTWKNVFYFGVPDSISVPAAGSSTPPRRRSTEGRRTSGG